MLSSFIVKIVSYFSCEKTENKRKLPDLIEIGEVQPLNFFMPLPNELNSAKA